MIAAQTSTLPVGLLLVPVLSTLAGGWLALRARRHLPLLMAVGAGLLLGTAFLDLLPEALTLAKETGQTANAVLGIALLAFLAFLAIDTVLERLAGSRSGARRTLRRVSGGLLILHSFRDGMAIGAAYAASHTVGVMVAFGIIAHDVGDGMNTVILSTGGERARTWDYLFLLADAIAPFLGGLLTIWWVQSPRGAVALLAVAGGFFLEMATNDFLPGLREQAGARWYLLPAVGAGVGMIYGANWMLMSWSS